MDANEYLVIWTVYQNLEGFPGLFVAKKWLVWIETIPTTELVVGKTLQEVRDLLPPHLMLFPRDPGDDPTVIESWF